MEVKDDPSKQCLSLLQATTSKLYQNMKLDRDRPHCMNNSTILWTMHANLDVFTIDNSSCMAGNISVASLPKFGLHRLAGFNIIYKTWNNMAYTNRYA